MSNLPIPQFPQDFYLNELCKKKLPPCTALNGITANTLSQELNLIGANSIKFYVEITGAGTIQIDILGSSVSGGTFVSNGVSKYFSTSQSFMLPCTSDFIKVQLTILSGTPVVTVRAQGLVDVGVDDVTPRYKDLGQVINSVNIAAGATVYSNWIDNVQWVRSLITLSQSDQTYDINMQRRDTALSSTTESQLVAGLPASPGQYISRLFIGVNASGTNGIPGYSFRVAMKNISASVNTYAKLNMQIMGV